MQLGLKTSAMLAGILALFAGPAMLHATDTSVPFIHADQVHSLGVTGKDVTVVVIDTGIDRHHPGLQGSFVPGTSFEGLMQYNDYGDNVYGDTHGTYMSLIITDASGVAPDADILPVRVCGPGGTGNLWDISLGIWYARMERYLDTSIRVINLSVGVELHSCYCDLDSDGAAECADEIRKAAQVGIIAFASTGNQGICGAIKAPACVSDAVPVAANYDGYYASAYFDPPADCADISPDPYWVTCFSNVVEGCEWFLAAPGYDINIGGFGGNGTSQATAHASGVAALMFETNACGSLNAYTARQIIYNTAADYSWAYPFCPLAEPKHINALAAVNATPGPVPSAVVGDLDCDSTVAMTDFQRLENCLTGPAGGPVNGFCVSADFPASPPDGDVDMADFAQFQLAFTGYGSGACCHWDGTCSITPVNVCAEEFGATYQGHDTTCVGVECPQPNWGACCNISTRACTESTREDCIWGEPGQGDEGMYLGDGTQCDAATCPMVLYHNVIDPLTTYAECGPGLQLADDIWLDGAEEPPALTYYALGVYGGSTSFFDVTVGLYRDYPSLGLLIPGTKRTFTDIPNYGSPVFLTATFDPPIDLPDDFWMVAKFSDSSCGWFLAGEEEIGETWDLFARCDPPWGEYWYGGDPFASLWADIGCIPSQQGACCWTWEGDWYCTEGSLADCAWVGGYFQGFGTACAGTDCNTASFGACCSYEDGACTQVSPEFCAAYGRVYQGDGTSCSETTCPYGRYRNDIFPCALYEIQGTGLALGDDMTLAGSGARELVYYSLLVYGGWSMGGSEHDPFDVTVELYTACPGDGGTLIDGTTFTWHDVPDDATGQLLEVALSGSPVTIPDTVWMVAQFSKPLAGWVNGGAAEVGSTLDRYGANEPPWGCNYGAYAGFWANLRCEAAGGPRSGGEPILTITPIPLEVTPVPMGYQPASSAVGMSPAETVGGPSEPVSHPTRARPIPVSQNRKLDPRPAGVLPGGGWRGPSSRGKAKTRSLATVTLDLTSPLAGHRVPPGSLIEWSVSATVSQGDNAGLALIAVDLVQDAANPEFFDLPPATLAGPGMQGFDRPDGIANPMPGGTSSAYGGTPMGPAGAVNLVQIGGAQNTFGEPGDTIGLDYTADPSVGQAGPQVIASGTFPAPATPGTYSFHLANGIANVLNVMDPPPTPPDFWPVSAADIVLDTQGFSFTVCAEPCLWHVPAEYPTIQAAIDAAEPGDTVLVADGIYTGVGNKNLDLQGKAIQVRSESGNPAACIIDCEGSGRGFYFHTGETASTVVQGFTIQKGYPDMSGPGGAHGGGVYCSGASPTLTNCTIAWNWADSRGGGVYCSGASPTLTNCTIAANAAVPYGGGIYCDLAAAPILTNCILWNVTPPAISTSSGMPVVTYCNVQGGWTGTGNLDSDPLFLRLPNLGPDAQWGTADDDCGDVHLAGNSPCIDAGDPASVYGLEPEPNGGRINMGVYGNTAEAESRTWLYVQGYHLEEKTLVDGTVFDYCVSVRIENQSSENATDVLLELLSVPDSVTIIDGAVEVSMLPAGWTVPVADTFTIRLDRETLTSALRLRWRVTYSLGGVAEERSFVGRLKRETLEPPYLPRDPVPLPPW